MEWRIEVKARRKDSEAIQLRREIHDLGYAGLERLDITRVYLLRGALTRRDADQVAKTTFADRVVDTYLIRDASSAARHAKDELEVLYHPGVSDPSEASIKRAIRELGFANVDVRSARRYRFIGDLTRRQIEAAAKAIKRT